MDTTKYNIYTHAKNPDKVSSFLKSTLLPSDYNVNTAWGHVVGAYLSLLKYAMSNDENNTHFILISESCIPLLIFDKLYQFLDSEHINTSYVKFQKPSGYDIGERITTQP